MRRVRRADGFEVNLNITKEDFINPPRELQRSTVINRALKEFIADINAINEQTKYFVSGEIDTEVREINDRTNTKLSDEEIMEDWQIPLMQKMADVICETKGAILEIGFGRGVSADMIQNHNVKSHTIIECNDEVITNYFQKWKTQYTTSEIRIVKGLWQNVIDDLPCFDGIFFHTYPLNQEEYMKYVNESITFAEHFFSYSI